ncbi:formate/nitrite transporter family protein [Ectobacillus ponti]|uniref:formate/nitrite transporter family protein n=1 Tax=Ectobacillus ponti TaxID=2961894 RepID=UPI0027BA6B56|nr:formate/nitrite transporter family protein [Ectobacillus ponti]
MEQDMQYVVQLALKKKQILDKAPLQYMIRAALAGLYIGFVIVVCFKAGEFFRAAHSPAAYVVAAALFGIALILIMYGDAELFTGNTMYFTVAMMRRAATPADTLRNWAACYGGNTIGALLFACLFYATGIFEHIGKDHLLNEVTAVKMNASTLHLFFKAVLCNWLVCLACFLPSRVKGDGAKITLMLLLVFVFFLSGYEHSIANLALFSIALLHPHPDTVSLAGALHNLVPVTLGNIAGGSLFVGMVYQYLSLPLCKQTKEEKMLLAPQAK